MLVDQQTHSIEKLMRRIVLPPCPVFVQPPNNKRCKFATGTLQTRVNRGRLNCTVLRPLPPGGRGLGAVQFNGDDGNKPDASDWPLGEE